MNCTYGWIPTRPNLDIYDEDGDADCAGASVVAMMDDVLYKMII